MKRFLVARVAQALVSLIALTFVVFASAYATGDPALYLLPPEANAQDYARIERNLGLDRPFVVQYGSFVGNAVQGDLGMSFYHRRPVSELLLERLPITATLATAAMAVALAIGIPLGVLAAVRRKSIFDRTVRTLSIVGMAVPQFWVALMSIVLFAGILRWLPSFGAGSLVHLVLPVATLSLNIMAGVLRLTRSSMIDALDSDYVKFARMKGLKESQVVWRHALRNALVPVLTFSGIMVAALLTGTVVIEQVFAIPGIGNLTLEAVVQRNFPLLQGVVLMAGSFYIAIAFLVDSIYAVVDPRIRRKTS